MNLIQDISTSDRGEELNLGMKVFRIITIGGVKHDFKDLRRQVVELIGKKPIFTLSRVAIAALKIKITQLLIEIRS